MVTSALKLGRTDHGYCVRVEGRGTMRESRSVHAFAEHALADPATTLVVDLSACEYLDSTFLGSLLDLHRHYGKTRDAQGRPRFMLARLSEPCRKLLASMRIDRLVAITEDAPDCGPVMETIPPAVLESADFARHVMECHRRLAELGGPGCQTFEHIADEMAKELARRQAREDGARTGATV